MCGEAIVIAGLSAYFFKENRKLQEQIKELKSELDKQKKENDKVFGTIFNVLETHLNPRQEQRQEVPQIPTIRKRNPPQQQQQQRPVQRTVVPPQPVPQQRPEPSQERQEPSQEYDLKEEMSALLQDDSFGELHDEVQQHQEEDVQTIDITDEPEVKDNGQVVVMMMSAMPPQ